MHVMGFAKADESDRDLADDDSVAGGSAPLGARGASGATDALWNVACDAMGVRTHSDRCTCCPGRKENEGGEAWAGGGGAWTLVSGAPRVTDAIAISP